MSQVFFMRTSFLLAAGLSILAAPAFGDPLTFEQALTRAEQSAPSLAARVAEIDATRSASRSAGRLPDPKFRAGFENYPVSGPMAGSLSGESMTMQSFGIMQDVPNVAKRRAAKEQASAEIVSAEAAYAVDARDARLSAGLAWVDLYFAKRKLDALEDIEKAIAPLKSTAASQVEAGNLRPAQSLEAAELAAAIADRRSELTAEAKRAQAELIRWTGDPTADISGEAPQFEIDRIALHAGLGRNPNLAAMRAMTARSDADVAAATAEKRPDWGWEVSYQRRDPIWGDMISAGVTISLPLFSQNRQDPMIESKAKLATRARYNEDAARRQVEAQLQSDLADHSMHHERLVRAQTVILPLAQRKADLEMASYASGTASLADVLQSYILLAEARIDAVTREANLARSSIRLHFTYGGHEQ
jgi:cobalt-zinc-cadmium efflux system outer membrane protein